MPYPLTYTKDLKTAFSPPGYRKNAKNIVVPQKNIYTLGQRRDADDLVCK